MADFLAYRRDDFAVVRTNAPAFERAFFVALSVAEVTSFVSKNAPCCPRIVTLSIRYPGVVSLSEEVAPVITDFGTASVENAALSS